MLRPDEVGDQPSALCRYIGRKTLRLTIAPQPDECAAIARRAARSDRIAIGISGSAAVSSRATKATPNTSAPPNSATTGVDSHG
ncbi:MAG: hypothetical protein WBL55_22035, partial [Xanthobacteraceae bacterium]